MIILNNIFRTSNGKKYNSSKIFHFFQFLPEEIGRNSYLPVSSGCPGRNTFLPEEKQPCVRVTVLLLYDAIDLPKGQLTIKPLNISHTLVGNKTVDHSDQSDVVGAAPLGAAPSLQLHLQFLHSRLNTWLQWIGQRQLQDATKILKFCDLMCLVLEGWWYVM